MGGMSSQDPAPGREQAVDVFYTLERPEARSILRGFWSKRLLRISPALLVLLVVYVRAVGPPYVASVITGLILISLTGGLIMIAWDQSQLKTVCRHVRVRWSPAGVQVAMPLGTKQFHWSEVTGCKISNRFVSTTFTDGKAIHVPKRAFASDADPERILRLANAAAVVDVRKRNESQGPSPTL
jgi:hypothetical protein